MRRIKRALLTVVLMVGALSLFAPPARAQTVTNIYNGIDFLWYTSTTIWSTNLNRMNISNLFVYMDQEFSRMKGDWGVTTPRSQYYLWVDPNTGGGFAAGLLDWSYTSQKVASNLSDNHPMKRLAHITITCWFLLRGE